MDIVLDNLLNDSKIINGGYSFLFGFGKKATPSDASPFGNIPSNNNITSNEKMDCSNFRALIVDDNSLNLKVAEKTISSYRFKIDTSTSGKDTIEKIQNGEQYDVIFMDYMMPGMDGIETLHELQKLNVPLPPVVVLTANTIAGMKEMYINEGFADYLAKPILPAELDRVVNGIFKG